MSRHITRRWTGAAAAVIAVVGAAAGCSSGGGSGGSSGAGSYPTINVAYMTGIHGASTLALGQQNGYWKKVGLNVNGKLFDTGPDEIAAMSSGSIDIAYVGPGAAWEAAAGHATVISLDSINYGDFIVAQPGQPTSLSGLRGKTIGYIPKTSSEMILRLALKNAGLTMSDIHPVTYTKTSIVPSFEHHSMDYAAIWDPFASQIVSSVPGAKKIASERNFPSQVTAAQIWVARTSFLKQHPAEVEKFLEGFILGNNYLIANQNKTVNDTYNFLDNPSQSKTVLASSIPTTEWLTGQQLLTDYQNGSADTWLHQLVGLEVAAGATAQLTSNPAASRYVDWTPFEDAMKNLPK